MQGKQCTKTKHCLQGLRSGFIFTAGEQEFYAEKGFEMNPRLQGLPSGKRMHVVVKDRTSQSPAQDAVLRLLFISNRHPVAKFSVMNVLRLPKRLK